MNARKHDSNHLLNSAILPWVLTSLVSLVAFVVWGHSYQWRLGHLSTYQLFPVFGLLGFSIMWSHYMASFYARTVAKRADLKSYFRYTGYAVLIFILLHPGLLIYQRFRDGYGLPPKSYESYVAPGMGWITLLGSVSLFAFLAFELHRWFSDRSWWKYIVMAGDVAMLAILYHGLRLGSQLRSGWFTYVWYFYGISLIGVLIYTYAKGYRTSQAISE